MVVYDIPLLFENITKYNVDYIVVATAAADVQRRRVLERPGMTEEKFQAILAKQVPDAAKRERADFLVHTDYEGYSEAKAQLGRIIEKIIEKNPVLWEEWKQSGLSEPVDDDGKTVFHAVQR
jgi:dephospho-CoA kinase